MAGISLEQLGSLFGVDGDRLTALRALLSASGEAKPPMPAMPAEQQFGSLAPPGANAGPDLMTRAAVNLGAADTFDVRDRIAAALRNVIPTPDLGKREQILASQSVMPGVSDPAWLQAMQQSQFGIGPGDIGAAGIGAIKRVGPEDVTRAKRVVSTTGQYVGAPPGVDSPQKLAALVRKYVGTMDEGMAGRDFYTNSSADILARAGNDPAIADPFVSNLAILSRSNNVAGNTSMSAKGHIQAVTGDVVNTGRFPSKDSGPVADLYTGAGRDYAGHKRDPFADQLSVAWAPERIGRGVNDMHEAEIMGYPSGKPGGPAQHDFMDEVRARAIAIANRDKLGGFEDWHTGNAQAAAWTGNKIRRGEVSPGDAAKDYSYFLPRTQANATYESFPGVGTGHLPNAPQEDYAAKLAFHQDPSGSWQTSGSGRDIGYTAANMLPGAEVNTVGRFMNEVNPATVAQPITATETINKQPFLTQSSRDALAAVEGARAYFDVQNAGAAHKIMASKEADYAAAGIPIAQMDEATMKRVAPLFESKGYYIANAPNGLTILANENTPKGADFAKDIRGIVKQAGLSREINFGRPESIYVDYSNAWKGQPGSATAILQDLMQKSPAVAASLEKSDPYRAAVAARSQRDIASGWGPPRADVLRAREIFQAQGWDGLWAAAKKGLVPMAAIAAVIGYGGPQAVFPGSQNEPQ